MDEWEVRSSFALRYQTEVLVNHYQDYPKAIELYKEFEKEYSDIVNWRQRYGLALWLNGQHDEAQEQFDIAIHEYQNSLTNQEWWCYDRAGIYATLGQTEEALKVLLEGCPLTVGLDHYITIDPLFKNLWGNDEFEAFVEQSIAKKTRIREQLRDEEGVN